MVHNGYPIAHYVSLIKSFIGENTDIQKSLSALADILDPKPERTTSLDLARTWNATYAFPEIENWQEKKLNLVRNKIIYIVRSAPLETKTPSPDERVVQMPLFG